MLKKAGIVVATAAAGLLAVSPLAFAGSKHDHHGSEQAGSGTNNIVSEDRERESSAGLVNVDALNGDILNENAVNVCDINVNVLAVQVTDIAGALGLLGEGEAQAGTVCDAETGQDVNQEITQD